MLLTRVRLVTAAWALGCVAIGAPDLRAAPRATPKYTNAEVLSVDVTQRRLVVRNNDGAEQTLELDDGVAGVADLRRGDRVILTLRGEAGRPRVEALWKAGSAGPAATAAKAPAAVVVAGDDPGPVDAEYSRRVADLARQADAVDRLWTGFRNVCGVTPERSYEGSREWLSLWEVPPPDLSSGYCRDQFNQIVDRGQTVNAGMAAAETDARRRLQPGTIREIERRYSLEWGGWGRTPPAHAEP